MRTIRSLLARLITASGARLLLSQESGIAAVEFAMILPIMVVLWIGGVEVTGALSVDRRLNNLASSIGDLVARDKELTHADVDKIFDIATGAMYPYCREPHTMAACLSAGLKLRVTEISIDDDGAAKVYWSRAKGTGLTAHPTNGPMNAYVPETLRVDNTHIVMAEVFYTYSPAVGYVITGDLELEDRMFFVPRLAAKVKLCVTDDRSTCTS
jgi:Flp pilus assembly protein TadG